MMEKICCFRCKCKFEVDEMATTIVCPRCGSGFERVKQLESDLQTPTEPKSIDIVIDVVDSGEVAVDADDVVVVDSVVTDKPGRRSGKKKDDFDAASSLDE